MLPAILKVLLFMILLLSMILGFQVPGSGFSAAAGLKSGQFDRKRD
jgi:hypothetical protein